MNEVAFSGAVGVETAPHPDGSTNHAECVSYSENQAEISKFGWGGPRANSGGRRPGAGRKPKHPAGPQEPAWKGSSWCVFSTFSQAEFVATQELARHSYEVYLPLIAVAVRDAVLHTMFHKVRKPLFPGYGFIRLTATAPRQPILDISGVRGLVIGADNLPGRVRDSFVERMRADDDRRCELSAAALSPLPAQASVLVLRGAFAGRRGIVRACDGRTSTVDLQLFGRVVPLLICRADLTEVALDRAVA